MDVEVFLITQLALHVDGHRTWQPVASVDTTDADTAMALWAGGPCNKPIPQLPIYQKGGETYRVISEFEPDPLEALRDLEVFQTQFYGNQYTTQTVRQIDGLMRCSRCQERLPHSDFAPSVVSQGRGLCRACDRERKRQG